MNAHWMPFFFEQATKERPLQPGDQIVWVEAGRGLPERYPYKTGPDFDRGVVIRAPFFDRLTGRVRWALEVIWLSDGTPEEIHPFEEDHLRIRYNLIPTAEWLAEGA